MVRRRMRSNRDMRSDQCAMRASNFVWIFRSSSLSFPFSSSFVNWFSLPYHLRLVPSDDDSGWPLLYLCFRMSTLVGACGLPWLFKYSLWVTSMLRGTSVQESKVQLIGNDRHTSPIKLTGLLSYGQIGLLMRSETGGRGKNPLPSRHQILWIYCIQQSLPLL